MVGLGYISNGKLSLKNNISIILQIKKIIHTFALTELLNYIVKKRKHIKK